MLRLLGILCFSLGAAVEAFSVSNNGHERSLSTRLHSISSSSSSSSRRDFFQTALITTAVSTMNPLRTWAGEDTSTSSSSGTDGAQETKSVQTPLYYILRVREATEQETRLIKSGKFKDVQRANVKLAVRFMIDNYRLNDNFIAASAFLTGDKKIKAVDLGQNVVQNLYTILEYFDSSDVENIKVSTYIFDVIIVILLSRYNNVRPISMALMLSYIVSFSCLNSLRSDPYPWQERKRS